MTKCANFFGWMSLSSCVISTRKRASISPRRPWLYTRMTWHGERTSPHLFCTPYPACEHDRPTKTYLKRPDDLLMNETVRADSGGKCFSNPWTSKEKYNHSHQNLCCVTGRGKRQGAATKSNGRGLSRNRTRRSEHGNKSLAGRGQIWHIATLVIPAAAEPIEGQYFVGKGRQGGEIRDLS